MTTYQDPPLQSRRAVRQNERAEQAPAVFPLAGPPAGTPEPLTYATRNRPPLPLYDGGQRGRRAAGQPQQDEPVDEVQQPDDQQRPDMQQTDDEPQQAAPVFRPRDFSPRTPRPAQSEVPEQSAGNLEYHTQARPIPAPAPVAPTADVPEYTLTRRELRALREAHGVAAVPDAAAAAPAPIAHVVPAPVAPAPEQVVPHAVTPPPVASPPSGLSAFDALFQPPSAPAPSAAAQLSAPPALIEPAPVEQAPVEQAPVEQAPVEQAPVEPVAPQPIAPAPQPVVQAPAPIPPAPVAPAPVVDSVPTTTPVGHWSNQAALDDAEQVNESTISRSVGVGSGAITTSALVLPGIPNHEFAKLGTGEILVTGSIDLPRSLSTAGAHPTQLDEHDLDHQLDPGDHQVASTDSAPVRAVRAISTHTSTRNVIVQARKPRGTRALTVLIASAAAMAVVVVTLLVVGLVSGIL